MKYEDDPYLSMNYNFSAPYPGQPRPAGPAWEIQDSAWPAFFRTTWQMLLHPGHTLSSQSFPGYLSLLAYALPWQVFCGMMLSLYASIFEGATFIAGYLLIIPVVMIAGLLVNTCFFHIALLLVGGARNGWRSTFRAMIYLTAGACLLILPRAGLPLYYLWCFLAVFPALAASHGISRLRVLGALLALLALFLLIGVAIISIVEWRLLLGLTETIADIGRLKF
jgi:hypothetical protein